MKTKMKAIIKSKYFVKEITLTRYQENLEN